MEGRIAIVMNAGRDAVDAGGALTNALVLRTAKSCGPVVQRFFRGPKMKETPAEQGFMQSFPKGKRSARKRLGPNRPYFIDFDFG